MTGVQTCALRSGIDGPKQVLAATPDQQPTYILGDLRELAKPYTEATITEKGGTVAVAVGKSVVTMTGNVVSAHKKGNNSLDLLRAGATAIYRSGLRIYGLDVDPAIYS